jgi:hypothetical protein
MDSGITPFSYVVASIFSQFVSYLLIFFMVSFAEKNVSSFPEA